MTVMLAALAAVVGTEEPSGLTSSVPSVMSPASAVVILIAPVLAPVPEAEKFRSPSERARVSTVSA